MIDEVKVKNFQSLYNVELSLGKFTVIVGPSSSGKSALTRALKAVTSNGLDSDHISRGTKSAAVSVKRNDTVVTIQRELGGSSVYKIAKPGSEEQVYSKLNRSVPAEVTEAIGILPSTQEVASINFAGQFDTPYLLKEGASSVARVLGELTNVSTIFSAVKEASRRAKASSTIVNTRKKDKEAVVSQLSKFSAVTSTAKKFTECEILMQSSTELASEVDQLASLLHRAQTASEALSSTKIIPELPDMGSLQDGFKTFSDFKALLVQISVAAKDYKSLTAEIVKQKQAEMNLSEEIHQLLVYVGKCPTCNQHIIP